MATNPFGGNKKILIKQIIDDNEYHLFPESMASIIQYGDSSVEAALDTLKQDLLNLSKDDGTIDTKIKEESDALYKKIVGLTDESTTINQAYDTLKEVSDYLTAHEDITAGFTTDITKLKSNLSALTSRVSTLETTVGDDSSGLVKAVADNTTAINNLTTSATIVADSTTNGNILVNNKEIQVYDDSAIEASKIVESTSRKFITTDEKTKLDGLTVVKYVTSMDDANEEGILYFVDDGYVNL